MSKPEKLPPVYLAAVLVRSASELAQLTALVPIPGCRVRPKLEPAGPLVRVTVTMDECARLVESGLTVTLERRLREEPSPLQLASSFAEWAQQFNGERAK